ncbi:MAG: hypothetical protein EOO24_53655, partial [Comamonadaceae bacterium]
LTAARGQPTRPLAFGHPSGVIYVEADVTPGAVLEVRRLAVQRTARRLAEGRAFLKDAF